MHAEKKNVRVLRKYIACAIAVMHIPIDNGHALQAILLLHMPCCQSYVIENAKARRPVWRCMVARWPNHCHTTRDWIIVIHAGIH
jgi:hypothetical protein